METVKGRCPMGCGKTLFLGSGGHITCSYIDCPNPGALDDIIQNEPVQVLPNIRVYMIGINTRSGRLTRV